MPPLMIADKQRGLFSRFKKKLKNMMSGLNLWAACYADEDPTLTASSQISTGPRPLELTNEAYNMSSIASNGEEINDPLRTPSSMPGLEPLTPVQPTRMPEEKLTEVIVQDEQNAHPTGVSGSNPVELGSGQVKTENADSHTHINLENGKAKIKGALAASILTLLVIGIIKHAIAYAAAQANARAQASLEQLTKVAKNISDAAFYAEALKDFAITPRILPLIAPKVELLNKVAVPVVTKEAVKNVIKSEPVKQVVIATSQSYLNATNTALAASVGACLYLFMRSNETLETNSITVIKHKPRKRLANE